MFLTPTESSVASFPSSKTPDWGTAGARPFFQSYKKTADGVNRDRWWSIANEGRNQSSSNHHIFGSAGAEPSFKRQPRQRIVEDGWTIKMAIKPAIQI